MKSLLLTSAAGALLALTPAAAQDRMEEDTAQTEAQPAEVQTTQDAEAEEAAGSDAERYFAAEDEDSGEAAPQTEDYRAERRTEPQATDTTAAQADEDMTADDPAMDTQETMAERLAAEETSDESVEEGMQTAEGTAEPLAEDLDTAEDAETLNRMQQERLAEDQRVSEEERRQAGMAQDTERTADADRMMETGQTQTAGQGTERPMMGAQDPDPQDRMAQTGMQGQMPDLEGAALIYRSSAALAPTALTAQELLGADLVNDEGKKLARVEDVIIDQQGMAQGVILAAGGLFGLGEDYYAVDFDRIEGIRSGEKIKIVSQLTEEDVERLREFDLAAFEEDMGTLMMASELRGMELPIGQTEQTASVDDVVMSRQGQVEALVVSYDGDRYVAPFSEIGIAEGDGGLFIDTEPRLIGAMATYEGYKNQATERGGAMMPRSDRMNRDAGMEPRMQGDRRMPQTGMDADMTEQGMGEGMEADEGMDMDMETDMDEEPQMQNDENGGSGGTEND